MSTNGMVDAVQQMEHRNDYEGQFFVGQVVDNKDPEKAERLRIRIPHLFGTEIPDTDLPWARPVKHRVQGAAPGMQSLAVPVVGSKMIVVLQNGDPYHPLYLGGLLTPEDVADIFKENYPQRYGIRDEKQNHMYVDTKTGDVDILHYSGLHIHVRPSGTVDIYGPEDLNVRFDRDVVVDVGRNMTAKIGNNLDATVGVNAKIDVGTNVDLTAGAVITVKAPMVNIN